MKSNYIKFYERAVSKIGKLPVDKSTFCPLPFTHVSTMPQGEIKLCCRGQPPRDGKNPNIADSSRLGAAEGLMRNASKYLTADNNPTPYTGIMSVLRAKINNDNVTKDLINYYRANPDEYTKINEAGRTYWGEFGGERYIDELAQNAIAQMAKTNFRQRGLTDYEKYMVALARQRRMGMKKNENVIPFPKQD